MGRLTRAWPACLATGLAWLVAGGAAWGAETGTAPCIALEGPGARTHDGFFARSLPGLAFLWAHVDGPVGEPRRSGVRGIGQSGELAVGGTLARGWVVGGSLWTARIDPTFIEDGRRVSSADDSVKWTVLRVGPFVDWYPDPSRGFHATAAVGLVAQFESDLQGDAIEPFAYGWSLATGAGYEWFVSSEMSLGFLGRFALGSVARSVRGGDEHSLFLVPEIALSATYH